MVVKDPLLAEKVAGQQQQQQLKTPEKVQERPTSHDQSHQAQGEDNKPPVATKLGETQPTKGKSGTPKKSEATRNVFSSGAKPSPKKNPWTRNTSSDGGRDGQTREGVVRGGVASSGTDAVAEGKGIEIPKGEVCVCVCVCVLCVCVMCVVCVCHVVHGLMWVCTEHMWLGQGWLM